MLIKYQQGLYKRALREYLNLSIAVRIPFKFLEKPFLSKIYPTLLENSILASFNMTQNQRLTLLKK
jgi:hypothetical protein